MIRNSTFEASLIPRVKFLRRGSILGVILELIFLFTGDISSHQVLSITVDLVVLVSFVCVFITSYHVKKYTLLLNCTMINIVAGLTVGLFDESAPRTVFLLSLVPVVGYLLLKRLGGIVWSSVIIVILVTLGILVRRGTIHLHINDQSLTFAAISCSIVAVIMYLYEGINIANEKLITMRDQEVIKANESLSTELANDKLVSDELKRILKTADKSKLALLNVLDDAKLLQQELIKEKAGVELKVEERTKQLRKQQTQLKASINSIENGFLMTFADNEKVTYNPALVTILELGPQFEKAAKHNTTDTIKYLQKEIGDVFDIKNAVKLCMSSRTPFSVSDLAIKDKFVRLFGAPVIDDVENTVIGTVVLLQDMTEAKLLERSKDEFMSIASHELRTPLTAIRGNASMLEMLYGDKMPNKDARGMLSDIKDSTVRLISIVNQFLATSRLEQKRTIFEKKPVDIAKSVRYCANELQGMIDEKKLKLVLNLPDDLPNVLADETRTQEVIVNLIGNAIKYTDKGSIMITAQAITDAVQVNFTDTGQGIDPKNHNLLFHKFQQASSNILTRDDSRSTGLGLYITKQLVEQMGGTIYLSESALGKGSTFTFTLPVASGEQSHTIKAKAKEKE